MIKSQHIRNLSILVSLQIFVLLFITSSVFAAPDSDLKSYEIFGNSFSIGSTNAMLGLGLLGFALFMLLGAIFFTLKKNSSTAVFLMVAGLALSGFSGFMIVSSSEWVGGGTSSTTQSTGSEVGGVIGNDNDTTDNSTTTDSSSTIFTNSTFGYSFELGEYINKIDEMKDDTTEGWSDAGFYYCYKMSDSTFDDYMFPRGSSILFYIAGYNESQYQEAMESAVG